MHWLMCPSGDLSDPDCLDGIANRERFIVVYPNGTSCWPAAPADRGWNDGDVGACPTNIDELGYFTAVLADLGQKLPLDEKRIYSTGLSNGGGMSHRLACEFSDRIAAIAPVSGGNQASGRCHPKRPVPIIEFHGSADQWWPYLGGSGSMGNNRTYKVNIPDTTVSGWAAVDGCPSQPVRTWVPKQVADGTRVALDRYSGCAGGAEIDFYTVVNGGHNWPGPERVSTQEFGLVNHDLIATQVIWDFLKRWSL
jgi:polyhydroxybutyrate depolymerase